MVRITTEDKPFDPFTEWNEWYFYDLSKGYSTCERLDRLAKTSSELSDEINDEELNDAIDQLIELGILVPDSTYAKLGYRYKAIYDVFVEKNDI